MSWSALSSLVAMPFGQLSPRKSESRACYLTNAAADKRSSGCAWLCHALLLTRLQLNFGVRHPRLSEDILEPRSIVTYRGQVVQLAFRDGGRERGHIVSVDPDNLDNHVLYRLLEVLGAPPQRPNAPKIGDLLAVSAEDISALTPTDGKTYQRPPGWEAPARPWWRVW